MCSWARLERRIVTDFIYVVSALKEETAPHSPVFSLWFWEDRTEMFCPHCTHTLSAPLKCISLAWFPPKTFLLSWLLSLLLFLLTFLLWVQRMETRSEWRGAGREKDGCQDERWENSNYIWELGSQRNKRKLLPSWGLCLVLPRLRVCHFLKRMIWVR